MPKVYICNPRFAFAKLTEPEQSVRRRFEEGRKRILVTSFRPVSLTGADSSILYSCVPTCTPRLVQPTFSTSMV